MATKRPRSSTESLGSPNSAKQLKIEEPSRPGRVRKKPAKFEDDDSTSDDGQSVPTMTSLTLPTPTMGSSSMAQISDSSPDTSMDLRDESDGQQVTPARASRARKKSAKVIEMEEFEEAEKKQTVKKETVKKGKDVQGVGVVSPVAVAVQVTGQSHAVPITAAPVLKIKGLSTSPVAHNRPAAESVIHNMLSPKQKLLSVEDSAVKHTENKESVIKLLLSSPTQSTSSAKSALSQQVVSMESEQSQGKRKGKLKSTEAGGSKTIKIDPGVVKFRPREMITVHNPILDDSFIGSQKPEQDMKELVPKKVKKKVTVKDESPLMPPPAPSPDVIHLSSMDMDVHVRPSLTASGKKGKKGGGKMKAEPARLGISDEVMHEEDFELSMSEIELGDEGDSNFMDMEEEDDDEEEEEEDLIVSDDEYEPEIKRSKGGKKKALKPGEAKGNSEQFGDSELVMDLGRGKGEKKKDKKADDAANKKKRTPSAYMMWCSANRSRLIVENPGIDFATVSKTLGEMWSNMSEKDKMVWKSKAKKLVGKGSTLITTGKSGVGKAAAARETVSQRSNPALTHALLTGKQVRSPPADDINTPIKGFGMEPIDVAAHLKIVGESLSIIGTKLQEHRGLIAVQGSLSVLLDSMLCAMAPLMCLTAVLPETDGLPAATHLNTLDNVAYIMPGL